MSYSSKKKPKTIYFTEDIIEILAAKTGKDKALLADIIKQNNSYIKSSVLKNSDIVVINFPNFGKMLFNYYLGRCQAARSNSVDKIGFIRSKLNYLLSIANKEGKNSLKNFNRPMVSTLTYSLFGEAPRNILTSFYKNWKILEQKHNEDHEKYF
jgi:hypothetical protein